MSDGMYKPAEFNVAIVKVGTGDYIPRHVVCAANRWKDGTIVLGIRHFCPMMRAQINSMEYTPVGGSEQGFVDQWGNFMTRDEALSVVKMNEQPLKRPWDEFDTLYSENLY